MPLNGNLPFEVDVKSGDAAQQRSLSTATWSDDGNKAARRYGKANLIENLSTAPAASNGFLQDRDAKQWRLRGG